MKGNRFVNYFVHNPWYLAYRLIVCKPFIFLIPDKLFILISYRYFLSRFPDLNNPSRYTEKLQWMKLNYHNPLYTNLVDKIEAKKYAQAILGENHIIPTIGVWKDAREIDFDSLPSSFVLKCNHYGGGEVFICKNKYGIDREKVVAGLNQQLKDGIYYRTREWPYKNVNRRILCEEYMEDDSGELRDYKFYCFDGIPKVMLIASNRYTHHYFNYFDMDFNALGILSKRGAINAYSFSKPEEFETMKEFAGKLSKGFPHVRVDLYCCNHVVYFGEMTFFDSSGYDNMNSDEWDLIFGKWLNLPSMIK